LIVELAMEGLQPMEQHKVARVGPPATRRPLRCRRVEVNRKFEELSFCGASQCPRHPRIQKPNHCLQHAVRRKAVAPMDAEDAPTQAEHHRLVRVGEDSFDSLETERL
jgi:hypothetical protein